MCLDTIKTTEEREKILNEMPELIRVSKVFISSLLYKKKIRDRL